MSAAVAKTFEYEAGMDRARRLSAEGCPPVELPDPWTPEHLLLAGLARCSLSSLAFHAARADWDVIGDARASGVVTKREEDGRYAFTRIDASLEVEIEPAPDPDALRELLGKAERDCFISASLRVAPHYRWRVNGEEVAT